MSAAWWWFDALPWALFACIVLAPRRPPYPRLLLVPVGALLLGWLTWLVLLWRGPTGGSVSLLLMFLVMVSYSLAACGGWALRLLWDAAMRWRQRRGESGEAVR